jgi:hypothetical protein
MRKRTVGAAEITKRRNSVAPSAPVAKKHRSLVGALKGQMKITGDIVSPIDVRWGSRRGRFAS